MIDGEDYLDGPQCGSADYGVIGQWLVYYQEVYQGGGWGQVFSYSKWEQHWSGLLDAIFCEFE